MTVSNIRMSGVIAYQEAFRKVKGALQPETLAQPTKATSIASETVNFSALAQQYLKRLQQPLDHDVSNMVKGTIEPGAVSAHQLATSVEEATFVVQQTKHTLDKVIAAIQELMRIPM